MLRGCFGGKRWGTVEALVAILGCLLCFRSRSEALLCQCANVASEADGRSGSEGPDGPGLLLSSRIAAFVLMPWVLRLWYLKAFYRHRDTGRLSSIQETEPRGCECPSRAPCRLGDKPVADARGKGRRRQAISSRNPSQEFVQRSRSTCPDQGLGHVLIHHYGNTASPPRQEYQNYTPQFQPRPFQAPLEIIVRIFSS